MKIQTGVYVGDGTDGHKITGIGFQPAFVFVKNRADGTNPNLKTSSMGGNKSLRADACSTGGNSEATDQIKTLDADGFTLGSGTRSNASGAVYNYLAIAADGSNDFAVGTYTGNGLDDRSITGVGFNPTGVWVWGEGARCTTMRHESSSGDTSHRFFGSTFADQIQSVITDGFTVGTRTEVNADTVVYYYVAWLDNAGKFVQGTYTGNGADNRSITGVGFKPSFVLVLDSTNGTQMVFVSDDTPIGTAYTFGSVADLTDSIQALESDGFQVGTHATVNTNLAVYLYMAWLETDAPVFVPRAMTM